MESKLGKILGSRGSKSAPSAKSLYAESARSSYDDAPPSSESGLATGEDPDTEGYLTNEDLEAYKDYQKLCKAGDERGAAMALKAFVKGSY